MDLVLTGKHGKTLRLTDDTITIEIAGPASKREKTVPIRSISWIAVKPPRVFDGYIQFSETSEKPRERSITLTGGAFDATKDENSVLFDSQEQYEIALRVKDYVESIVGG